MQDAEGNAIGGLSVGEPAEEMYAMTEVVCDILPEDKTTISNGCWYTNKYIRKYCVRCRYV